MSNLEWYRELDADTRGIYNKIENKLNELILAGDIFQHLEEVIAENMAFHRELKRSIKLAEIKGKEPHSMDKEYVKSSISQAVEASKQFAAEALRSDPSKLARLDKVANGDKPKTVSISLPALITGRILMIFIETHNRLPKSRTELLKSVPDDYRPDVDARLATLKSKFLTRGLQFYDLAESILDKRGRKS